MSLIAATQWTAVATIVLAVFAIVTAVLAYRAFRSQFEELGILQQERQREVEDRRRAQATRVYITATLLPGARAYSGDTPPPPAFSVVVHNTADRPVYDVRVHWVTLATGSQAGTEDRLGTLGPQDRTPPVQRGVPAGTTTDQFIPVAYFRDAAGLRWTITPNGDLEPVDEKLVVGATLIGTRAATKVYPERQRSAGG